MKKTFLILSLLILAVLALALTVDDIRFCLDHEFFYVLEHNNAKITELVKSDSLSSEELDILLEYAIRLADQKALEQVLLRKASTNADIESALAWIRLKRSSLTQPDFQLNSRETEVDYLQRMRELYSANAEYNLNLESLGEIFSQPADSLLFYLAANDSTSTIIESKLLQCLPGIDNYNNVIENYAKGRIDDIGIERRDSLALEMIERFYTDFPRSRWHQAAYYYQLYHLRNNGNNDAVLELINSNYLKSPEHSFISTIFLASPTLRKALPHRSYNSTLLEAGIQVLRTLMADSRDRYQLLYTVYDHNQWQNKLRLQIAKLGYYKLLDSFGCYGDEDSLFFRVDASNPELTNLMTQLEEISFSSNENGELAELHFWMGKVLSLVHDESRIEEMVSLFAKSLIHGSPRSSTKEDCENYIRDLHRISKVKTDPLTWIRNILGYQGPRFRDRTQEAGLADSRYSRVAVGDYNNDGWHDLLLGGNKIFTNNWDGSFNPREHDNFSSYPSAGGLWADFNRDGRLDFMTISHDELMGEQLMKQMPDSSFVSVNERAGDIANYCPTEGAAWIDTDLTGYPSLYLANYEKWQEQSGYPDNFWENRQGYFTELSQDLGFLSPTYTREPGLAGRGVAPADFDNDGTQEILVTNYRLTRNFFWKMSGDRYMDIAALSGVQGSWSDGYYGHSIGADWGDYDNDGDLDLFVANLAHPRFLDFSDISALYRNDGMSFRVIEADTLHYWQFT
ncbi:MAG: VCBS repeat-containing protein, partial [Candidatus Cloacimonadota bacterium]